MWSSFFYKEIMETNFQKNTLHYSYYCHRFLFTFLLLFINCFSEELQHFSSDLAKTEKKP